MLEDAVDALLALPATAQLARWRELLATVPAPAVDEAWNSAFGAGSLFQAWTSTTIATQLYEANRAVIRRFAAARGPLRIVEIGAGDGRLWQGLSELRGELIVVDPEPDALAVLAASAPAGLTVRQLPGRVQEVALPEVDLVVCSLTLHHVAGRDGAERQAHGLTGPGKIEVLRAFGASLRAREGLGLLNEADVFCDLALPPGELLREHLFDSYVRRCARSVCADLRARTDDADLAARWRAMLYRWFLEQPKLADVPIAERDVYELDVARWLELLDAAGLTVQSHGYTDDVGLFQQYVLAPGA